MDYNYYNDSSSSSSSYSTLPAGSTTIVTIVVVAIVCGIIGEVIGKQRGRNNGFWWGFFLGPIGWIIIAMQPAQANVSMNRECPHCKEPMRRDASVCPHCQRDSAPWTLRDGQWTFTGPDGVTHALQADGSWQPLGPAHAQATEGAQS